MHKDERLLSQKEKETMLKYLDTQNDLLNTFFFFMDADIRPPEELIEIFLSFADRNGATQKELTDWKKKILNLPVKATTIEGTA